MVRIISARPLKVSRVSDLWIEEDQGVMYLVTQDRKGLKTLSMEELDDLIAAHKVATDELVTIRNTLLGYNNKPLVIKKKHGRFKTYQELENWVLKEYYASGTTKNMTKISLAAEVEVSTISGILKKHPPEGHKFVDGLLNSL